MEKNRCKHENIERIRTATIKNSKIKILQSDKTT